MNRTELKSNYERVIAASDRAARSRSGKLGGGVTLIVASKTQTVDAIEALYELGHRDFGENYVQEMVEKAEELERRGCKGIRWHFIGHLQSKKAKSLVPWVASVHSIDSESTAKELSRRWLDSGRDGKLPIFVEVNIDGEDSKVGVPPTETPKLVRSIASIEGLDLRGLMCIPAPRSIGGDSHRAFAELRELERRCKPHTQGELSMGMSSDYETAIVEGASHVRVGSSIFGQR